MCRPRQKKEKFLGLDERARQSQRNHQIERGRDPDLVIEQEEPRRVTVESTVWLQLYRLYRATCTVLVLAQFRSGVSTSLVCGI